MIMQSSLSTTIATEDVLLKKPGVDAYRFSCWSRILPKDWTNKRKILLHDHLVNLS